MFQRWAGLLARVRANKGGATFNDLAALLEGCGFVMRPPTATSHRAFVKSGCVSIVTLAHVRGTMKIGYVLAVLRAVEECCRDE